jgi:hypothetical protein
MRAQDGKIRVCWLSNHPRRHGIVRGLVNHDKAAGGAVVCVTVEHQRLLNFYRNARDVVHVEFFGGVLFQRVYVYAVVEA